jgi:hypothetical protein
MPKYKLIVMTRPVAGREQEYNDWYQGSHLPDLVSIYGVKSAQRFRLSRTVVADPAPLPYLAIYDIETDDIDKTLDDLRTRVGSGQIFVSSALSKEDYFGAVYEEFGPAVTR